MKIYRGSGSHSGVVCTVELAPNFHQYIDATRDVRYPEFVFLEYVRDGFVRKRDTCLLGKGPERIKEMIESINEGKTT